MSRIFQAPYALVRAARPRLAEDAVLARGDELAIQARLFAGEFGVTWQGEDGETVEILHFGSWNREAGPDFCGAKVVINGSRLTGDIELDPGAGDWEAHGHARNRAYSGVVLHMFLRRPAKRFFTRTADHRTVTQVCLNQGIEKAGPPDARLGGDDAKIDERERLALVEAAARFRLARKSEALQRAVFLHGRAEALFQAAAAGLGYKHNTIPFLLVAQRAGMARARRNDGEALLFGLAGFLTARNFDSGGAEVRSYLGRLWKAWWKVRDRESRIVLAPEAWRFAGVRPANHPHRRMGALAAMARIMPDIERSLDRQDTTAFLSLLTGLEHPFWRHHATLSPTALPAEMALVGEERARDLLINLFLPAFPEAAGWRALRQISGPVPSRKVRKAAEWLGLVHGPPALAPAFIQQGLLQLYDDFYPAVPSQIRAQLKDRGWTERAGRFK